MMFSRKVFWTGGVLGCTPVLGTLFNIPDGYWLLLNPLGILLMAFSFMIEFHEKYDIVPKEPEQ